MATTTSSQSLEDEQSPYDAPEPALPFPVVGIGGSAGGLEAVSTLLRQITGDTGMSFVYISHLSPTYPSHLPEILGRQTHMPVVQVTDEPMVEPNHVYVIPPNRNMFISGGKLRVRPRDEFYGPHRPIDDFLRSLAADQGRRSIGVILSGLGDDGTIGLEEIKGAGGFAFAQDASAAQDSMPRSAEAAGCVDLVLPPAEIAHELVRMASHPYVVRGIPEGAERTNEQCVTEILQLIHSALGVDFSSYKRNTIFRRIMRRMALNRLENLSQYVQTLRSSAAEVEALFRDILINVTRFFRDPDAFERIKTLLPTLAGERSRHDPLRIWVVGCSTGEEAYSLAILCQEFAEQSGQPLPVQIFATDLNAAGIEKARSGLYSRTIEQDVSPERLRKFFVPVDDSYRVSKSIREMCVFARHNGLTEPPFSRMDLVSCRNMLIYLDRNLQQKLIPTLHYALKPNGYLWIGSADTVGSFVDLFDVEDLKQKIFRKKAGVSRATIPVRTDSSLGSATYRMRVDRPSASPAADLQKEADRIVLARYAPAGVLVDANLDILQFRGDTGPYLAPSPGKPTMNLLKMLREGLLVPVRGALTRAKREDTTIREEGLTFTNDAGTRGVEVEVIPVRGATPADMNYLVLFEEAGRTGRDTVVVEAARSARPLAEQERDIERLTQELGATREYLQSVIEQQDAANEELQSANEEVQSANEELQSINEELETSKEEIQSSNEELATVNEELQNRNAELSHANNDMLNLLASVRMPIVMLGADLRIRRFTPMAEKMLNLRLGDIGRSIGEIKLNLSGIEDIESLVSEVVDTVTPRELDVQDRQGRWYSLRLRPYRTLENVIDGAVLLLVDIDSLKRGTRYAEDIIAAVAEPLLVLDADLRVQKASHLFYQAFDTTPEKVERVLFQEICGGEWNVPELRRALDGVRYLDERMLDFEATCSTAAGERRTMLLNAQRLTQDDGGISVVLTIKDITERKALEETLRGQVEELAQANRRQNEFLALLAHELRNPLAALRSGAQVLELAKADAAAMRETHAMIIRQVAHMARMVDDLLDVSRITTGRIQLRLEALNLTSLVQRCCDSMRPVIEDRGKHLDVEVQPEPIAIDGDAVRLEQVLGNLLTNASKFTSDGGHILVRLEKRARAGQQDADLAVLHVCDDGIGLSEEMLPRVFEPFMQVQRSSGSSGGLGIGLTLVRRLVELHGGTIEAASPGVGKGSCFEVLLPIRHHILATPPAPAPPPMSAVTVPRVLVVDDNVDAAESMGILLGLSGHNVRTVFDGKSALDAVAEFHPDAILLDIGLPGLDGYEVARRVRQDPAHARTLLIALTGYGQEEDRRRSAEAGFDLHLVKPVDMAQVEAQLAALASRERETAPADGGTHRR